MVASVYEEPEAQGLLHLAWSPDGSRLSYTVMRHGATQLAAVYTVNADGSHLTKVADGVFMGDPAPSPDGTRLVYSGSDGQVYVMNLAGRLQHGLDVDICGNPRSAEPGASKAHRCIADREAHRYGPFKALGNGDPPGIED